MPGKAVREVPDRRARAPTTSLTQKRGGTGGGFGKALITVIHLRGARHKGGVSSKRAPGRGKTRLKQGGRGMITDR